MALVGVGIAALLGFVAWSGFSSPSDQIEKTPPAAAAAQAPAYVDKPTASLTTTAASSALVLSASRGNCWLLVRKGGANGAVLYEGTLAEGSKLTFAAQVWVEFGAPWNIDAHRGAKTIAGLDTTSPLSLSL